MDKNSYEELRKDAITDFITDLDDRDKVSLWNVYCGWNKSNDDRIEDNNEDVFNEVYRNTTPHHIAMEVAGNRFNTSDDYIVFSIYGPKTFNRLDDDASPYCEGDMLSRKSADELLRMLREAGVDYSDLEDVLWDIDAQMDEEEDEPEDE